MEFAEWEAAHAAGCDMWLWDTGAYTREFKAKVMAWHELHNLVGLHTHDAAIKKPRRKGGQ